MTVAANQFHCWCTLNCLTLNLGKSKVLFFSTLKGKYNTRFKENLNVTIDGYTMEVDYRYLGVILDEHLEYHTHISMIKQQIAYRLSILRHIGWLTDFKESLLLYKSSILCYIDQGDLFFSAGNKSQHQALQIMQNRCLRVMYGKKNWPGIEQAHEQCNLLFIKDRRILSLLKYAHRLSFTPDNLKEIDVQALRSNKKLLLKLKISRTTFMDKAFFYKVSKTLEYTT